VTRPGHPDPWTAPWHPGPQQRCTGAACTRDGSHPGPLVAAVTLTDGLCAACARGVDESFRKLREAT
jgi:hypothetical protein